MSPGRRLRDLLATPGILVCPGFYNGFSARLVEQMEFKQVKSLETRFVARPAKAAAE